MLMRNFFGYHLRIGIVGLLAVLLGMADVAEAQKLGLHLIYMEPNGPDAEGYSEPAGGIGIHAVLSLPRPVNMLGLVIGLENIYMGMETRETHDPYTGETIIEDIWQRYTRLFFGAELGGHGRGFLRPHIGMNFAVVNYGFEVDVVTTEEENFITQNFKRDNHWLFGQDITLGLDLRVSRKIFVDFGIRYLKTYSVPVQLNRGLTTVYPEYFQVYLAVGGMFESIGNND
jgi:hypothetical protein